MRGNLKNKLALMLVAATLMVIQTTVVWADEGSFWDDLKDAGSEIYQDVKEKAPEVYDAAKEKAGEAYDYVSEKAPELYDAAKEKAGQAAEAVQEFRHDSEDEFWERFELQTGVKVDERTYTSGKNPETATSAAVETSEAPTESGQSEVSIAPNEAAQAEPDTASIEQMQNDSALAESAQIELMPEAMLAPETSGYVLPTDSAPTGGAEDFVAPKEAKDEITPSEAMPGEPSENVTQSDEVTGDNVFRLGSIVGGILLIVILLGCFLSECDIWRYNRQNRHRRR